LKRIDFLAFLVVRGIAIKLSLENINFLVQSAHRKTPTKRPKAPTANPLIQTLAAAPVATAPVYPTPDAIAPPTFPVAIASVEVLPFTTATDPPGAREMVVPPTTAVPPGVKVVPPTLNTPLGPAAIVDPPIFKTGPTVTMAPGFPPSPEGTDFPPALPAGAVVCFCAVSLVITAWPWVVKSLTLVCVTIAKGLVAGGGGGAPALVDVAVAKTDVVMPMECEHSAGLNGETAALIVARPSRMLATEAVILSWSAGVEEGNIRCVISAPFREAIFRLAEQVGFLPVMVLLTPAAGLRKARYVVGYVSVVPSVFHVKGATGLVKTLCLLALGEYFVYVE